MAKRDYYTVLRSIATLPRGDQEGHRKLAMKHHPDRTGRRSAEEKFKEAKEAYEILTDTETRAAYDQFGHAGVDPSAGFGAGAGRGAGHDGFGGFSDAFGDIFGEIFGAQRGGRGNGVYRGADLRYNLELGLEDAARGTEAKIRIPTHEACETVTAVATRNSPAMPVVPQARRSAVSQGFFSISRRGEPWDRQGGRTALLATAPGASRSTRRFR
jgi:molecular chaperone DnaJ